jgi:hypothetical protein
MSNDTTENLPDALRAMEEEIEKIQNNPAIQIMRDNPGHRVLRFPYGSTELVMVCSSDMSAANLGRIMRVTKSRRSGRRGNRHWDIRVRDAAQLPKKSVKVKANA